MICVNYNSDDAARRYIESLTCITKQDNIEMSFVLVDNSERSSSQSFFKQVQSIIPSLICIKSPVNSGYFGGARLGFENYLATNLLPDWVIVSNVDLEIRDKDFIFHLRDLSGIEKIAVIAPSILSLVSKHDWNPQLIERPSKIKMHSYKYLFRNFYLFNSYQLISKMKYFVSSSLLKGLEYFKIRKYEKKSYARKNIYSPHGSFIIFSKQYFAKGGNLSYPKFLFGEEIFVAETVRSIGLTVVYYPAMQVYSYDHVSTSGKVFRSRKIASYIYESAVFIAERYFM